MKQFSLLISLAALLLLGCAKSAPDLPFEGTWNNSTSGKEGMWFFITKSEGGGYIFREAVGRPDNMFRTKTARVSEDGHLLVADEAVFGDLLFLDATHNTLVTVKAVSSPKCNGLESVS